MLKVRPLGLAAALAGLLAGCVVEPVHLYPVNSVAAPTVGILSGHVSSTQLGSSSVSFQATDGETFAGSCINGSPEGVNSPLRDPWDSVFGQGDYLAHVVGSLQHCTATLAGSKGTTLNLEFYREAADTVVKGIGLDSAGHVYKLGT